MNKKTHQHGEAFCHMIYEGTSSAGHIRLSIWNSRDGVTPFITVCSKYGIQLQHWPSSYDRYDPEYKPKKGDLIWVSYDENSAKASAEEQYDFHMKFLNELRAMSAEQIETKYGYDAKEHVERMLADKEKYIADAVHEMVYMHGEPQPRLVLVEEDWK